jgi:hypothetical protein
MTAMISYEHDDHVVTQVQLVQFREDQAEIPVHPGY